MDIALIFTWILRWSGYGFQREKLYLNNIKRTIGNIAHLRKVPTNKHICTKLWLYHNIDQERNTLLIRILMVFIYTLFTRKDWDPFTRGCFVPSLIEIDLIALEKNISKFHKCVFAILLLSSLGKAFEQTWNPFTSEYFAPGLVKFAKWLCRRRRKCEKLTTKTTTTTTTKTTDKLNQGSFLEPLAQVS